MFPYRLNIRFPTASVPPTVCHGFVSDPTLRRSPLIGLIKGNCGGTLGEGGAVVRPVWGFVLRTATSQRPGSKQDQWLREKDVFRAQGLGVEVLL